MIDLHCHLLPGVDDGAKSIEESIAMARLSAEQGVETIACTPHMTPGVFENRGSDVRERIARLQLALEEAEAPVRLVTGADVHVAPNLVVELRSGAALSLNDTRYVLIEPPHHVFPPRLEDFFFGLMAADFTPVLTHPERLTWIARRYDVIQRLFDQGVWMQVTAGALLGDFGGGPKYWAERMLDEGMCHILATDAHNMGRRRPNLRAGFEAAAKRIGEAEATNLVCGRPRAILENRAASATPRPVGAAKVEALATQKGMWSRALKALP